MRRLVIERAGGQLERLLMTPMNYVGFILGKLVPWFFIGMGNVILFLVAIRWFFDVPIRGDLFLLLVAAALYVATVLSLGSCIAAGARDMGSANTTWSFIVVPAFFVSGYVYPLSALPKWLLPFSYLIPQTHFIEIMRGVCLRGADARELAPHLLYLAVAPIILSLVAAARFHRSILD
jgi:ABC-2 type transport system permease protein